MKTNLLLTLIFLLIAGISYSQAPQGISYQGIARNANGLELQNQNITLRLSVLQGSPTGTTVYVETHTTATDTFGLFNVTLGMGTIITGTFDTISWGAGSHYVKTEMDTTGGTSYQLIGTTQLLSVPYALYAETGNYNNLINKPAFSVSTTGDTLHLADNNFIIIPGISAANDTTPSFTCGTSTITDIDGNTYNTVEIGSQCWFKENLKTTKYADNTPLVDGTSAGDIAGDYTTKYYFDYADNPANTVTYGKLYTWVAIMNSAVSSNGVPSNVQGVCPTGWHLPSEAEWNIMEKYLDSTADTTAFGWVGTDIGGKLKETGTTHWNSPNTGATNSSGFTALPGGNRDDGGTFNDVGLYGDWWTATQNNASSAWVRDLTNSNAPVYRTTNDKAYGFSVRCLKD